MARTKLILLLSIALSTSLYSQNKIKGNRTVTVIETEVNSFNKLIVGEKFKISILKDDIASVEIKTDENLHDVIDFNVADSVLRFKTNKRITSSRALNITVRYTEALKVIELVENSELNSINTVDNQNLILRLNDNAKANLNIRTNTFKLINNNTSTFKINSKTRLNIESKLVDLQLNESCNTEALITCDSLRLDMYQRSYAKIEGDVLLIRANTINSSKFVGKNLTANECEIISEDSSEFAIQVLDDIYIEASGTSEVSIYGNPKINIKKFIDAAKLYKKEL